MEVVPQWLHVGGIVAGLATLAWAGRTAWMHRDILFLQQPVSTRAMGVLSIIMSLVWVWVFRHAGAGLIVFCYGLVALAAVHAAVVLGRAESGEGGTPSRALHVRMSEPVFFGWLAVAFGGGHYTSFAVDVEGAWPGLRWIVFAVTAVFPPLFARWVWVNAPHRRARRERERTRARDGNS